MFEAGEISKFTQRERKGRKAIKYIITALSETLFSHSNYLETKAEQMVFSQYSTTLLIKQLKRFDTNCSITV